MTESIDEKPTDPIPPPFEEQHDTEPRLAVTASTTSTELEVQRAISDEFTAAWFASKDAPAIETAGMYGRIVLEFQRTALELRHKYQLEPVQVIAGATRWIWDFAQRQAKLSTHELGQFLQRNWVRFEQGGFVTFRAGAAEHDDVLLGVACWLFHFARNGNKPAAPGLEVFGATWPIGQLLGYMQKALAQFDDQHGQAMRSNIVGRS